MKAFCQIAVSLAALGGVLAGSATAATPIAELPLKASVLAKPNVIFGMDDSGSMDWEVLLDTSSGLFYWNGATAWDSARGKPVRDDNTYVPYAYLFPVGTASGGQIYPYNSVYGQALPPTPQLAWARSAQFNPIYYNSLATYPAWSPAYFGGSLKTYANASTTVTSAHPAVSGAPTLNVSSPWSSTSAGYSSNGYMFYLQDGMKVPAGAYLPTSSAAGSGTPCSGSTWRTTTGEQTVSGGRACWAAIPYYPATFWHPQSCTVGADCVNAPDGSGTLKRYEIKSTTASYPSGRTYAAELQNFANWFSYYRKRKLMLAASMGRVLENISGLRLGNLAFNENVTVTMYDADGASSSSNRFAAAGEFYLNSMSALGTPTHQNIKNIAAQYNTNTSIVQYACQRNSMFVVTDGFSNTTSIAVPSYDKTKWGNATPYKTTPTGSLADLALAYYTNRLRTDLPAGRLPPSASTDPNADKNTDLHINTYAITLGVRGALWPNTVDPFVTAPTWSTPTADDPSMIDDQWHGTINGRGKMYLATTPDETAANIKAGLEDILSQVATQSGLAVSTVNLSRGDSKAYLGTYNPAGWTGDLQAVDLNPDTGVLGTAALWSASSLLAARDWTTRVIATWGSSGGTSFASATVGGLVNPANTWGTSPEVVDYLRGDRTNEGSKFRTRKSLIGAVINGEPAVDRDTGVVYFSSGEGMLHAIDTVGAAAGTELWAYVPGQVLPDIGQTSSRSYSFKTQLDGSPVVRKIGTSTKLLVSNMGVAGRGYFALDITSPRGLTEATLAGKALWEFPSASDTTMKSKVGQTLGKAAIVRLSTGAYAALVTSGYNNTFDGRGRLWVLNASTGAVIKEFVTADGTLAAESGLAHIAPFAEPDGSVRYVYGGDLLGNVWRIDLDAAPAAADAVFKLAQLRSASGAAQPVTAAPELMLYKGQRIVYVGTGRLLDIGDFGSSAVQSIYAISDGSFLSNARSSLVPQVYSATASGAIATTPVDWTTQRGWYMDLPAGEQINTRPTIAYGALTFAANKAGATDCSASAKVYAIDVLTGGKYAGADFISWAYSDTSNVSAVTALLTRDGKTVRINARDYNSGAGSGRNLNPNVVIAPAKNSWREIRR